MKGPAPKKDDGEQIARVRQICLGFAGVSEKLSHGEPTFFVKKRTFCMFADNHHDDGHLAVWVAAPEGVQEMVTTRWPRKFFRPPYVGVKGWIGIELTQVDDQELAHHLSEAWRMIGWKR